MTNLVQFPGLGLSFELSRVASALAAWIFIGTASASPSASASHWSLRSAAARSSASTPIRWWMSSSSAWCWASPAPACIMWRWHPIITIPSGMCWPSATAVWPSTAASSAPLCSAAWPANGGACRCCPCSTWPAWASSSDRAAAAGATSSIRRLSAATPPCPGACSAKQRKNT